MSFVPRCHYGVKAFEGKSAVPVTRRQALVSAGAFAAASRLSLDGQTQSGASDTAQAEPVCLSDFEPLANNISEFFVTRK